MVVVREAAAEAAAVDVLPVAVVDDPAVDAQVVVMVVDAPEAVVAHDRPVVV